MFWPFNRYTHAPPPWGGSQYNVPVELRQSSFQQARTGQSPKYAARVGAYFDTPMPQYMVSPGRPYGAYSKHPGDAMQAVQNAHDDLRALADYAVQKYIAGLPLSQDEGRALIDVHMPQVSVARERRGAGAMVRSWDVPFVDRSTVPNAVLDQVHNLATPAIAQRKLAVGVEIALIEGIRAQWMKAYPGARR